MTEPCSRRERKKELTRQAILQAAKRLFAERGFQAVTIAEVAEAADVAQQTIFNHFRSKEDLFFGKEDESAQDPVVAVAGRASGESVLTALRRQAVTSLERVCGAQDAAQKVAWMRMLAASPALQAHERKLLEEYEDALAAALQDELSLPAGAPLPRLLACQYIGAKRTITRELRRRLFTGESPTEVVAGMIPFVHAVYDQLEQGLAGVGVRVTPGPAPEPAAAESVPAQPAAPGPLRAEPVAAGQGGGGVG